MTDFGILMLALAALYLSECCLWIRRSAVVFRTCFLRRYGVTQPPAGLGSLEGGLVFLNPLPPFGAAFVCHPWPVSLAIEGAYSYVAQTVCPEGRLDQTARHIPMEGLAQASSVSGTVYVQDRPFFHLGDPEAAGHYARVLRFLSEIPSAQREAAIRNELATATDTRAIAWRIATYHRATWNLRFWCHVMFVIVFLGFPGVVGFHQVRVFWPCLVAGFAVCLGAILRGFYKAHVQLMPFASGERWRSLAIMILTPTAAIRACDRLSRSLLATYHPLAVATVLCPPEKLHTFGRRVLLDVRHPLQPVCPDTVGPGCSIEAAFRTALALTLDYVVVRAGYDPALWTKPPLPEDPSAVSYCPRCDTEYVLEAGICHRCGGIPLRRFHSGRGTLCTIVGS